MSATAGAPRVTVVITCFNYGRFLEESVGSVLAQTFSDLELIVIDDGSTDDSVAIATALAATDPRVRVIAQENAGQPAIPRNRAIREGTGEYVVSLDADDVLAPEMLERCVAVLDADPAVGMAWPRTREIGDGDRLHAHLDFSVERLTTCNCLPCCTVIRRAAFEDAGGYNLNVRGYEDWDLWLGIVSAGWLGAPAWGAVWGYRKHGGGVYSETTDLDQARKAQVVANRPLLFTDAQVAWAHGVLAGDPAALAITAELGHPPRLADPPRARPLVVSADFGVRADWYLMAGAQDVASPFGDAVADALDLADRLGYTAAVDTAGAVVARKRAADPVALPIPFPRAGEDPVPALAAATRELLTLQALRAPAPLETGRTAAYCGVGAEALGPLLARVQGLMGNPAGVGADEAGPVARLADVVATERRVTGDADGARRAARVARTARRAGLEEARRVAVLAYADELIADGALLDAYGGAFGAQDDVTLVIVTEDVAALLDAVSAAGLEGEASPDLLAVAAAPEGVDAILSRRAIGPAGAPRYDERTLPSLRALVDAAA
jgi:hypothetical protein